MFAVVPPGCCLPWLADGKYLFSFGLFCLWLLSWAARYNTWLCIKLTPTGEVVSFLFSLAV